MPKIMAATVAEHRERTYDALLDAVDALVVERGFEAVSLREIAARAGVARTAIYNYAPDKAALLAAAAERSTAPVRAAVAENATDAGRSAPERLAAIVHLLLVPLTHSTQSLLILQAVQSSLGEVEHERTIAPLRTEIQAHLRAVIQDGIDAGDYAPVTDIGLTVGLITGAMEVAIRWIITDPASAVATATATASFLHNALSSRTAPTIHS